MSVGFPASVKLNQWCFAVSQVFGGECYLVGSAIKEKNTRDVDIVCMMDDALFEHWCGIGSSKHFGELDWRWAGLCTAFSEWGKSATGLNIDFKLQPDTLANERHGGKPRSYQGGRIRGCYWKDGEWHEHEH